MARANRSLTWFWLPLSCMFTVAASLLYSQQVQTPQISADDLVRETVAREVAAANKNDIKFMFRSRKQNPKGSQTRLYVETADCMAGMLVAVNDKPISSQQKRAETDHLNWLASNPDQIRKKHAREQEDTERTLRIVKALPDAFRYQYDGAEMGDAGVGKSGDALVKLKFTPNPSYSPPSRVEQVLEGMQGYLLIDSSAHRIARIDGTLLHDVSFGWGIIGRLDKGGHFVVTQADVGDGTWEITGMSLRITGKILLIKGISLISDEKFTDFRRVPNNLNFKEAVPLLENEQEKLAHLSGPGSPGSNTHLP